VKNKDGKTPVEVVCTRWGSKPEQKSVIIEALKRKMIVTVAIEKQQQMDRQYEQDQVRQLFICSPNNVLMLFSFLFICLM
jgi:hypothetical protein